MKITRKLCLLVLFLSLIASINPTEANAAWKKDSNGWWYTEGDSWARGWRQIDGKWYYFYYSNGYMAHDYLIDGQYWLRSNGEWDTSYVPDIVESEHYSKDYLQSASDRIKNKYCNSNSSQTYEDKYQKELNDYKKKIEDFKIEMKNATDRINAMNNN